MKPHLKLSFFQANDPDRMKGEIKCPLCKQKFSRGGFYRRHIKVQNLNHYGFESRFGIRIRIRSAFFLRFGLEFFVPLGFRIRIDSEFGVTVVF